LNPHQYQPFLRSIGQTVPKSKVRPGEWDSIHGDIDAGMKNAAIRLIWIEETFSDPNRNDKKDSPCYHREVASWLSVSCMMTKQHDFPVVRFQLFLLPVF